MNTTILVAVILVPAVMVVFALFLVMWRERTTPRTAAVAIVSGVVLAAWLVGTSKAALSGFYFPPVSGPPPVGVQLTVALAGLTFCLAASPSLRSLLTNQQNLIRLNVWRLVGAVFVALMFTRTGPRPVGAPCGAGGRRDRSDRVLGRRPAR